jgi:hypothetical protein
MRELDIFGQHLVDAVVVMCDVSGGSNGGIE